MRLWFVVIFLMTTPQLIVACNGYVGRSTAVKVPRPPNHRRHLVGRHVCTQKTVVSKPIKHVESYCKPVYKSQLHLCDKEKNKYCTTFRVVYEKAYRTVYKITSQAEVVYVCCAGWTQLHHTSHGCTQAVCDPECQNGGTCTKPDNCACQPGWIGKNCATDVDECATQQHNCDHKCINTNGSFRCACHEGFSLNGDGKSCKVNLNQINEFQEFLRGYEDLAAKIVELEKENNMTELMERVANLTLEVASLKEQATGSTVTDIYGTPWDRIHSLSEQISMLEERLDGCTCTEGYPPSG